MTGDVTTRIVIDAPRAAVAEFASEPDNAPRWYGRRLEYVYEVAEFVPLTRLVMRTADGPFPMETTYEWEPAGNGTRMTLRNRGTPSGFTGVVAPFMSAAMRQANRKDLSALKAAMEHR